MPKCLKCNKPIDYLITSETRTTGFTAYNGKPKYDVSLLDQFEVRSEPVERFNCPLCGDLLFTSEGEAVHFFENQEDDSGKMSEVQQRD